MGRYRQLIHFRSESERSIGGKDDTLADSNERGDKGFITTSVVHLKHCEGSKDRISDHAPVMVDLPLMSCG